MASGQKRVDVRLGAFACSIQGFDDPVPVLTRLLRASEAALAETPGLAGALAPTAAADVARLLAGIAEGMEVDPAELSARPGLIVVHEPAAEAAPGAEGALPENRPDAAADTAPDLATETAANTAAATAPGDAEAADAETAPIAGEPAAAVPTMDEPAEAESPADQPAEAGDAAAAAAAEGEPAEADLAPEDWERLPDISAGADPSPETPEAVSLYAAPPGPERPDAAIGLGAGGATAETAWPDNLDFTETAVSAAVAEAAPDSPAAHAAPDGPVADAAREVPDAAPRDVAAGAAPDTPEERDGDRATDADSAAQDEVSAGAGVPADPRAAEDGAAETPPEHVTAEAGGPGEVPAEEMPAETTLAEMTLAEMTLAGEMPAGDLVAEENVAREASADETGDPAPTHPETREAEIGDHAPLEASMADPRTAGPAMEDPAGPEETGEAPAVDVFGPPVTSPDEETGPIRGLLHRDPGAERTAAEEPAWTGGTVQAPAGRWDAGQLRRRTGLYARDGIEDGKPEGEPEGERAGSGVPGPSPLGPEPSAAPSGEAGEAVNIFAAPPRAPEPPAAPAAGSATGWDDEEHREEPAAPVNIFAAPPRAAGTPGGEADGAAQRPRARRRWSDTYGRRNAAAGDAEAASAGTDGTDPGDGPLTLFRPAPARPPERPAPQIGAQELAWKANAHAGPEQVLCAAAWLTFVKRQPRFSRKDVFSVVDGIPSETPRNLEARVKAFGRLIREGEILQLDPNTYMMGEGALARYAVFFE